MPRVKARVPSGNDLHLAGFVRIVDQYLHQKPVELRLGQRVRAFVLDRVLGRQHRKHRRQRQPLTVDRRLPFFHRLEQGGLRLWRRAVYLVGQQDVGKYRSLPQAELRRLHVKYVGARDVGRHQVGRKLYTRKLRSQYLSERLDRQRLRRSRHALDQRMALGKDGNEDLLDNFVLTHDRLAKLVQDVCDGWWSLIQHLGNGRKNAQKTQRKEFSIF